MELKRIDVKVSQDTYDAIINLAIRTGAKPHPVTKRPIIQDIVADLIRIGIEHYSSTEIPVDQAQELEDRLYARLSESVLDTVTTTQLDYRAATIISRFDDAIANLKADLDNRIKVVETEIGTLQQQKPKTTTRRQAKTTDNTLQFES